MENFNYILNDSFSNVSGTDEFPLSYRSSGNRVEQLKKALRVLGEPIDEVDYGFQTRAALTNLGYTPFVNNKKDFNKIILRAYSFGGKKSITLTEPQMRLLYEKEIPFSKRSKSARDLTTAWYRSFKRHGKFGKNPDFEKWARRQPKGISFEKWLKRQGIKERRSGWGGRIFDTALGWLQLRTKGIGDTEGAPSKGEPTPRDAGIPTAVKVIGGIALGSALIYLVATAIAKQRAA